MRDTAELLQVVTPVQEVFIHHVDWAGGECVIVTVCAEAAARPAPGELLSGDA